MRKLLAIMGFAIGVSTAALAQLAPAPAVSGSAQMSLATPSVTTASAVVQKG